VLRQGGYERGFFIWQTPDLIDKADAIINVKGLAALTPDFMCNPVGTFPQGPHCCDFLWVG
jgi:hypothetical protein